MLKLRWDKCNKWLYFGKKEQYTIMFDNWCWFSKQPTIREWKLFGIMWDNGAFWAADLIEAESEDVSIPHMNGKYIENDDFVKKTGELHCFVEITIVGIGFRCRYEKNMTVYTKKGEE